MADSGQPEAPSSAAAESPKAAAAAAAASATTSQPSSLSASSASSSSSSSMSDDRASSPSLSPDASLDDGTVYIPEPEELKSHPARAFNLRDADLLMFFIVPLEGCVYLTLDALGFPLIFTLACNLILAWLFSVRARMSLAYLIMLLRRLIVHLFFREVESRNSHNIPRVGPVVFVCAPHANQFLDPAVMLEFVPRDDVHFLIAAKSYKRGFVGRMAKAMNAIPVERPQDIATPCTGQVKVLGCQVTGQGTAFTAQFGPTDSILVAGEAMAIASIQSDTALTTKAPHPNGDVPNFSAFKKIPKLDQSQVFKNVWDTLAEGKCIGIFPEGGSHDRTDLLPLKAGVTIMALGAAAAHPGLDVKVQAVGLNYFHGHRFRGRVFVEFGDPFSLNPALVEKYKKGGADKIQACGELLSEIAGQLKQVTTSAPSWEELQVLWAMRRLYQPSGVRLPKDVKLELIRRFAEGYEKAQDFPEMKEVRQEIAEYNLDLKHFGIRDHQVNVTALSSSRALARLVFRSLLLLLYVVLAAPGALLNLPIVLITRHVSKQKAEEALKASNVKVAGRDVLATWKVMTSLSLVPLVFAVYPALAALVGWCKGWGALHTWGTFAILQPFMMYSAVRLIENGKDILRSLRPLYLAARGRAHGGSGSGSVSPAPGCPNISTLRSKREALKLKVRALVEQLGPKVFGPSFAANRIFSPTNLRRQSHMAGGGAGGGGDESPSSFGGSGGSTIAALSAAGMDSIPDAPLDR